MNEVHLLVRQFKKLKDKAEHSLKFTFPVKDERSSTKDF
jgi:hypothetical protein